MRTTSAFLRTAALCIVLALLATACSGGGGDDGEPAGPTSSTFPRAQPVKPSDPVTEGSGACRLLNRAEVEAALGVPVNAGSGTEAQGGTNSVCSWKLRSSTDQQVVVGVGSGSRAAFDDVLKRAGAQAERIGSDGVVAGHTAYALSGETLIYVLVLTKQAGTLRNKAASILIRSALTRL